MTNPINPPSEKAVLELFGYKRHVEELATMLKNDEQYASLVKKLDEYIDHVASWYEADLMN